MRAGLPGILGWVILAGAATPSWAHFHILLPQAPSSKRGDDVELIYRWGHPFEHQMFDADLPQAWFVLTPDGGRADLLPASRQVRGAARPAAFRAAFAAKQRGDYTCVLQCPPVWMAEDEEFLQDAVRVTVHVQGQKGWDVATGLRLDLVPLTRPYGLMPGMVFQAQALADGKPLAGSLVEVERYNATPPKELPPDEHITRTAKTDPNGVVTTSLTEPGWWCLTARRPAGLKERAGKNYPVRQRATIWVHVDPPQVTEGK